MRKPDSKEVDMLADYLEWRLSCVYDIEGCDIRDFIFRCLYDFYFFNDWMEFNDVPFNLYAGEAGKVDDYII